MCTTIQMRTKVTGGGKGAQGWFPVTQANVGYDHTSYLRQEHALLLDFVNPELGPSVRLAVELDIASGKALIEQLQAAIQAAEESEFPESVALG
jgi:Family of unknown function (DUF6295)